jgi:hypothetical protein
MKIIAVIGFIFVWLYVSHEVLVTWLNSIPAFTGTFEPWV